MTYKESDFPALLKFVKALLDQDVDPVLFRERVEQLVRLYERVPLYPGIATLCAQQGVKEVPLKDVPVGRRVYVRDADGGHVGTVAENGSGGLRLESVRSSARRERWEPAGAPPATALVLNEKVLEELWPSLAFAN